MISRTLTLACLLLLSSAAFGQDLSGTWVAESNAAEHTNTHKGDTITGTAWGGPVDPELKGSLTVTGGPLAFRGTWENSKPGWKANGTMVYHVVDKDTLVIAYAGTVYNAGNAVTFSYADRMLRKGAAPPQQQPGDPLAGRWRSEFKDAGSATFTFTRRADGTYDFAEDGLGNSRGTATLVGDKVTIVCADEIKGYASTCTLTLKGETGVGTTAWTKKPADEARTGPFETTITRIPDAKN